MVQFEFVAQRRATCQRYVFEFVPRAIIGRPCVLYNFIFNIFFSISEYTIFVVLGQLPHCEADELLKLTPVDPSEQQRFVLRFCFLQIFSNFQKGKPQPKQADAHRRRRR